MQQHVSQPINHTHRQRWLCLDCIGESVLKCGLFTAWIICVMSASKLKPRPANKSFGPSKGLKCNLVLTHWRRLTKTDLGSPSTTYSIWGLMKTCSKVDAAGGGFKEMYRLQMRVCAFVSSTQWRRDLGQKAKSKAKATESSRAERQPVLAGKYIFTAQAWPSSKNLCFFSPVEISWAFGVLPEARFRNFKKVQTVHLSFPCLICLFSIVLAWLHFYFSCNGASAITNYP